MAKGSPAISSAAQEVHKNRVQRKGRYLLGCRPYEDQFRLATGPSRRNL